MSCIAPPNEHAIHTSSTDAISTSRSGADGYGPYLVLVTMSAEALFLSVYEKLGVAISFPNHPCNFRL